EDCKMVFVVRTDLSMTKGKIAAQCGHATLMCYKSVQKHAPSILERWERLGQAKIALKWGDLDGEEELETLAGVAASLGVVARIVRDAGRTQIKAGSATVLGIGPAPRSIVDQITGHLKLL
ncbi:peptidyl-tRNA hydrolase, partial [Tuber borchii]